MQRDFITVTTRILDWDPFYPSFSSGEFDTARGEWHFIFPTKLYFPYGSPMCNLKKPLTRWWFQIFFIFTPTWGNDPIWLIFFRWVETTNELKFCHWPSTNFLLGKRSLLTQPNRWCYLIAATWRSCSLHASSWPLFDDGTAGLGVFVGIRNKEDRVGKDNFFTNHPFFFDCMSVFTQVGCFCYCFCKLLFLVGKSVTGLANPNSCCKKALNRCQISIIGIQEYRLSVKGR